MDDFSLEPGVPNAFGLIGNEQNAIAPRKRPLSSMTPTIALDDDGRVRVVVGAAGGPTIITATAQVFINVVDWKLDGAGRDRGAAHPPPVVPRAAGRRARDRARTRSTRPRKRGHKVKTFPHIGTVNLLVRTDDGGIEAAAEPRSPSNPAGY